MADLPTNYLDDILAQSMNGKRKYRITRADGTFEEVILEDVSEYEQVGSNFGASDINKTNQAVNEKFDSGDVVDPMLTTEEGFAADAYKTKLQFDEQNKKIDNKLDRKYREVDITTDDNGRAQIGHNADKILTCIAKSDDCLAFVRYLNEVNCLVYLYDVYTLALMKNKMVTLSIRYID